MLAKAKYLRPLGIVQWEHRAIVNGGSPCQPRITRRQGDPNENGACYCT